MSETGVSRSKTCWMCIPDMARAMTSCWISLVPSKIVKVRLYRLTRTFVSAQSAASRDYSALSASVQPVVGTVGMTGPDGRSELQSRYRKVGPRSRSARTTCRARGSMPE